MGQVSYADQKYTARSGKAKIEKGSKKSAQDVAAAGSSRGSPHRQVGQKSGEINSSDSIHGRSEKWVIDRDSMNFRKPPTDMGDTPARRRGNESVNAHHLRGS